MIQWIIQSSTNTGIITMNKTADKIESIWKQVSPLCIKQVHINLGHKIMDETWLPIIQAITRIKEQIYVSLQLELDEK